MKVLLSILLSTWLPVSTVGRLTGSDARDLQGFSLLDYNFDWLGIPIDGSTAKSLCPKEWEAVVSCISAQCPDFENVCPESWFKSAVVPPPTKPKQGDTIRNTIPTCTDMASSYCETFAAEGCCWSQCARAVYALPLCIIDRTTEETRDQCSPPKNCNLLPQEEDAITTVTEQDTAITTETGKCFGAETLPQGTLGLGLGIGISCDSLATLQACSNVDGCYWSELGMEPDCFTTDDCDDGYFCSIFSNGTQSCRELTCANWQLGPPRGEPASSEAPCSITGDWFCGTDGDCHVYNCQNWYQFGPHEFTGYDATNPIELECQEYSSGPQVNANAVAFGCNSYQPGENATDDTLVLHFNRQCFAQASFGNNYTCYEMDDSTEYRDFRIQLARFNEPTCSSDPTAEAEEAIFFYQTVLEQERPDFSESYDRGEMTSIFYTSMAEKTMHAKLVSEWSVDAIPTAEEQRQCSIQNASPWVCAQLMAEIEAVCDCYNFCDGQLSGCLAKGQPSNALCPSNNIVEGCSWDMVMALENHGGVVPLPGYTWLQLNNPESPQSLAYSWLAIHPNAATLPEWRKLQLFALVTFYYSFNGDNWPLSERTNYLSYVVHECEWGEEHGQNYEGDRSNHCNDEGRFTNIFLDDLKETGHDFQGTLPPEIALLGNLTDINFWHNNLHGRLSDNLPFTLTANSLKELNFPGNRLNGTIPTEIGLMTSLLELNLKSNELTGPLPSELGLLTKLTWLRLDGNSFSGKIPTEMGLLTAAERIDLSDNLLSGRVPSSWCGLGIGVVDSSVCGCSDSCYQPGQWVESVARVSPGE